MDKKSILLALLICLGLCACGTEGEPAPTKSEEDGSLVLTEEIRYNEDGSVLSRDAYTYDYTGRVLSESNYSGADQNPYNVITYTYEEWEDGTVLQIGEYTQRGGTARSEVLLDSRGNCLESRYYNRDGSIYNQSYSGYVYDEQGRIAVQYSYADDGVLISKTAYTYDDMDRMLSMVTTNSKGECLEEMEWVYLDGITKLYRNGELISGGAEVISSEAEYYDDGTLKRSEVKLSDGTTVVSEQDEAGRRTLVEQYQDGDKIYLEESAYDKEGNMILLKVMSEEHFTHTEYVYTRLSEMAAK